MPPKQVLEVVGFAQHEDSTNCCATAVKEIAYTSPMGLVLSHQEGSIYSLSAFLHDCREKNNPFKTKQ